MQPGGLCPRVGGFCPGDFVRDGLCPVPSNTAVGDNASLYKSGLEKNKKLSVADKTFDALESWYLIAAVCGN